MVGIPTTPSDILARTYVLSSRLFCSPVVNADGMLLLTVRSREYGSILPPVSYSGCGSICPLAPGTRYPAQRCVSVAEMMKDTLTVNPNLASRVKSILEARNLTLHRVSQLSGQLYGLSSLCFIPHNFYQRLRSRGFGPSLHQLCALSRISGYQLFDWLTVFGFDRGTILQLQILLPAKRTILLDPSFDYSDSWIPWFRDKPGGTMSGGVVPLGRLLERSSPRRVGSLVTESRRRSLYAKIGFQDALAFPDLLPGSIVRVDPVVPEGVSYARDGGTSERIFLVEHSKGFWCSRLHFSAPNRVHPISNQLSYSPVEFKVPVEARIRGVVDLEIRRLNNFPQPDVPKELASTWKSQPLGRLRVRPGEFIRRARKIAGLSLREASAASRKVADFLGDERYFAAPGSLCDYEAQDNPPRHTQKIIMLGLVYGFQFADFLAAVGIKSEELGKDSIPGRLISDSGHMRADELAQPDEVDRRNPILASLKAQYEELPFFLRGSLATLSGVKNPSLREFFWLGPESCIRHPYTQGGLLVSVNRHRKRPLRFRSMPLWRQPLYVLLTREGEYRCASCSLENGVLVVNSNAREFQRPEQFRNSRDAEVVGQVITLIRRLA